jgi:hypothetical protein
LLNRSASVRVAEGQPARLLGLIDSTSAYESASPPGLTVPLTCGIRRRDRSVTAKVTAKW